MAAILARCPALCRIGAMAAALAAFAYALPAAAQQGGNDGWRAERLGSGWYGVLSGAWLFPRDVDGNADGQSVTVESSDGFVLYGGAGYRFSNNFRLEGELSYGSHDYDSISIGGASRGLGGDRDLYALTAAIYYDIDTGTVLTPYLGAGGGLLYQNSGRPAATANGATVPGGDNSTDLTAFGEVGLSYKLSQRFDLVPSYRYQWINDNHAGLDDSDMHVLRLGLRYWFD
ncbi:MAG TPA: porin family protein [Ferrovibrio sp.]|uniref:porin family protein n=1 Tax=Ferrovibrio sp. TaxID=1917215 RepID=UPI002ED5843F